jgi:hypothetical protein
MRGIPSLGLGIYLGRSQDFRDRQKPEEDLAEVSLLAAARRPRLPAASRLDAVGIVLWGLRVGVGMLVVIGTIGSLIKARYTAAQWFDLVMFGNTRRRERAVAAVQFCDSVGVDTCIGARWPASTQRTSAPRSSAASIMRSKSFERHQS